MDVLSMTVQGTVTENCNIKMSKNNNEYLSFHIACHRYGLSNEDTYFIKVLVFNEELIKNIQKFIKKGRQITVIGSFSDKIWHKKNGNAVIERTVKATEINLSSRKINNKKKEHANKDGQQDEGCF